MTKSAGYYYSGNVPRLPKTRKKFKSATAISRVSHSDHYIQKAMREYEEKRMIAIRQEENSRTEMMIQRMRDREALKQWRQQMLSTAPSSKAFSRTSREKPLKRLDGGRKPPTPPTLEEKMSFLSTQLMVLRDRQKREMYGVAALSAIDREQLCHIILRKEAELLELQRFASRVQTVPEAPKRSATVINNRPTTLSSKEEALRNRIREHAVKLREFHKNDKSTGTKVAATENLKEANVIHSEMRRFNQEYRFKAFTGEFID
eukprot:sb/3468432/